MTDFDIDDVVHKVSGIYTVNLTTTSYQGLPEMVSLPGGESVIFYYSIGGKILARKIDAGGTPVGGEITIESSMATGSTSATLLRNGNIVVAFTNSSHDIVAKILTPQLQQVGSTVTLFDDSTKPFVNVEIVTTADGFAAVAQRDFQVSTSPYDRDTLRLSHRLA